MENKNLIEEFKKIANKGWIKGVNNRIGSVGLTFEKELGKKPDSMYFPDYQGIEIKCTTRYSKYPLFLFTVAFEGPTFPEINRIVEKYGYYDKDFKDKKVLYENLSCNKFKKVNNKYKFKLDIDKNEEKLYLCVYDLNENLIERESFVYLDTIKTHLEVKLRKLAVIYASNKTIKNQKYFRYFQIKLYKLKTFSTFLQLLENGEIDVGLIARLNKSGIDKGRYRNKNLEFRLKKHKIEKLFEIIEFYNKDE